MLVLPAQMKEGMNAGMIRRERVMLKLISASTLLAPGIYMAKISVWDKEMMHPYVVRNRDVFRIEYGDRQTEGLFLVKADWSINKG